MILFTCVFIIVLYVWMLLLLYVKITRKKLEFSLPIWVNAEFYVLITSKITKIGIQWIKY